MLADARLIQVSSDLKFDRSLLTGEADAINGHTAATDENYLESKNICFSGTSTLEGSGLGIVVAIGDKTMIGRLTSAANQVKAVPSTLQKELNIFTLIITLAAIVVFVVAIIVWAANFRTQHAGFENASTAILVFFLFLVVQFCFLIIITLECYRCPDGFCPSRFAHLCDVGSDNHCKADAEE